MHQPFILGFNAFVFASLQARVLRVLNSALHGPFVEKRALQTVAMVTRKFSP
jgi:hypothetical protein